MSLDDELATSLVKNIAKQQNTSSVNKRTIHVRSSSCDLTCTHQHQHAIVTCCDIASSSSTNNHSPTTLATTTAHHPVTTTTAERQPGAMRSINNHNLHMRQPQRYEQNSDVATMTINLSSSFSLYNYSKYPNRLYHHPPN